jgi:hypothetical protein
MHVIKVCARDVVIVDLMRRKVAFSARDKFKTEGHGSVIRLRDNKFFMAAENVLYAIKY